MGRRKRVSNRTDNILVRSQITLAADGGVPDIESVVGNANFGGYKIELWDSPNHSEVIGTNDGTQPENRFSLKYSPAELVTRRMVWNGKVRPFQEGQNLPFSVECCFYQNDTLITEYDIQPKATGIFSGTFELVVIICSFKLG
jgi:hypothetical protein